MAISAVNHICPTVFKVEIEQEWGWGNMAGASPAFFQMQLSQEASS